MTRLPRNSARRSEDEGLGSFEPFSKGARPWEHHATELRRLAGVPQGGKLDPWQLAPKVGLLVLDGMGHDLPTYYWPSVIEAITALASRAAATA